jgi:hypothetical protein
MDETRFGTGSQCLHMHLNAMTNLEKVSKYSDPGGQPLGQERYTLQEEQPW